MYVAPPAQKSLLQNAFAGRSGEDSAAPGSSRRPAPPAAKSSAAAGRVKQRGIYSEFLDKTKSQEDKDAENGMSAVQAKGIVGSTPAGGSVAQKPPKASSFKRPAPNDTAAPAPAPSAATATTTSSFVDAYASPSSSQPTLPRLEPKVLVPYEQRPGKPPRRIEIERKKRLFAAQDIEQLLSNAGVHYDQYGVGIDHATGQVSYLPLEIFDNTDFEARQARDWIELGRNEMMLSNPAALAGEVPLPTTNVAIPVKALRFEPSGPGHFVPAEVISYDEEEEKFVLRYIDTGAITQLHRIHIYFEAESPFDYVKRVVFAHAMRRRLESSIRYSLYVDHMPTDGVQPLDSEQVNRILLLALNTKKLKQNALDTTSLLNEVNIDYGRTMNKIIFDVNLKDPNQAALRQQLQIATEEDQASGDDAVDAATGLINVSTAFGSSGVLGSSSSYQYLGVVRVPFHDFPKHFSNFCFHSFYTKLEAITALVKVNSECLRLQKLSVFNTSISKSVRLEEFEQLQNSSMVQLSSFLKDKWILSLKNCIKNSLREVGKGWLNLHEKNREVYQFSKLKKFMKMVEFCMEDSLRFLIEDSLHNYQNFINTATKYKVTVTDTNEVKVVTTATAAETIHVAAPSAASHSSEEEKSAGADGEGRARDFALFNVDLVLKDGVIQYTTSPSMFQTVPLTIFDKALVTLHDIPQLETHVMEHLFWYGNESKLVSVQREEPHVTVIYESIAAQLSAAVAPMQEYIDKFKKYDDFLALNIDAYVTEFASLDNDLNDIRKEISDQIALKDRLESEIPKSVWLGLVTVNCEDVRRKLSMKCAEIIQKELDYFAKLTKTRCEELTKNFKKIEGELKKQPADIQELTKLKEYMATVPLTVSTYRDPIGEAMDSFDVLDQFNYRLPKDLFKLKWQTFGWPKSIQDMMDLKELALTGEKHTFLQEMRTSQEEFMVELLEVEKRVNTFGQYSDIDNVNKIAEKCVKIHEKLEDLQTRARNFNNNEILFALPTTDYRHVTRVVKNFEPYYQLWTTSSEWLRNHQSWLHDSFLDLNGDNIATDVATYNKTMAKCIKSKAIKDNPGCLAIASNIKKELEAFRPLLPLIIALRNPGMRDRHWDMLSEKLPFPFQPDESMTLTRVIDDFKLQNYLEIITKVGDSAGKEYQIESSLNKMESQWSGAGDADGKGKPMEFDIQPYKKTLTFVVRNVDEAINLLDEHIITTQAMQFSPFKKVFDERINRWANKLNLVSEVIEEWLQVQRQWISLQAIFQSPDINKQLPAEGKRFASVNKTWRLIMSQVHANPDVLSFGDNPSLLQKLQDSNKLLQMVQKRLSDYLDKKRAAFARFYFLANEELLAILSQTTEPTSVQPHLKKIFENISRIEFDKDQIITAMFSAEDERVDLVKMINPKGKPVEAWLGEVEQGMKDTMKHMMVRSVADYPKKKRSEWVRQWPGQCVLNGSQVHWTAEVEAALRTGGVRGVETYHRKWCDQLTSMVELVRGDLNSVEQLIMGALIVLDVHARDVIEKLISEKVTTVTDFAWIAQMRYYMEEADNNQLWVQMVQSRFPYSWEYLGNTPRLVITPLTDRCYLTLMSALQLHLGGAPAGPAGTGKTETTKDLAKAVAKQCVVFNCSDGLNYLAMGKFFKGLASSGAWACFDEFNRIDIEVLSVVAQQIQTIWDAIRVGAKNFIFEETEIKLEPTCSVFITMNPGYAGRTELPDNLQALFRPVAMMVPDYGLIGQIMMYSFGFEKAQTLSQKMVATFRLCSEQLSSQDHYDYGMRAVKTVITRAGILKKEFPKDDEDELLLRALIDVNEPKFLKPDLPLFAGIISDLFPTTKKPAIDYGVLRNSLILTCKEDGLQPVDSFIEKCLQLFDTTVVRHGVMLVGSTGSAKTTNIRTLQKALTRIRSLPQFARVKTSTLNPKAITQDQLYGYSDPYSNEWTDGTLAQIMRCVSSSTELLTPDGGLVRASDVQPHKTQLVCSTGDAVTVVKAIHGQAAVMHQIVYAHGEMLVTPEHLVSLRCGQAPSVSSIRLESGYRQLRVEWFDAATTKTESRLFRYLSEEDATVASTESDMTYASLEEAVEAACQFGDEKIASGEWNSATVSNQLIRDNGAPHIVLHGDSAAPVSFYVSAASLGAILSRMSDAQAVQFGWAWLNAAREAGIIDALDIGDVFEVEAQQLAAFLSTKEARACFTIPLVNVSGSLSTDATPTSLTTSAPRQTNIVVEPKASETQQRWVQSEFINSWMQDQGLASAVVLPSRCTQVQIDRSAEVEERVRDLILSKVQHGWGLRRIREALPMFLKDAGLPTDRISEADIIQVIATVQHEVPTSDMHDLAMRGALMVSQCGAEYEYTAANLGDQADFVYMLHDPLTTEIADHASGKSAFTFRQLQSAWTQLNVPADHLKATMITELNPLTALSGEVDSTLPQYDSVCRETMSAALRAQPKVIMACGSYVRSRWLRMYRDLPLVRSGRLVHTSGVTALQLVLASGHVTRVVFAPHPCVWFKFDVLASTIASAHDLPFDASSFAAQVCSEVSTVAAVSGSHDFVAIEVAGDDGRFVLADGALTHNCFIDDTSKAKKWVIFDGPVDALWIENMNTVLDDNKKLCLVSGEILQLTPTMTMFFEVEDLAVASPATVSRCGMVYMEPQGLIPPMVRSWLDRQHQTFSEIIRPLQLYFDLLLEPAIQFVRKNCAEPVPSTDNNLAASLMRILDCILAPHVPIEGVPRSDDMENNLAQIIAHIEPIFILALIWSVGGTTDRDGRRKFSAYLRSLLADSGIKEQLPTEGLVYDYMYDYTRTQKWILWMDSVEPYKFDDRLSYSELIVPTQDRVRYTYLLDMLVKQARHVLFTGATGTGKCWGLGTEMMMFDGSIKKVEDIVAGDVLIGDDSLPRIVQAGSVHRGNTADDAVVHPGAGTYRITSNDSGRVSWTCNGDHILVLKFDEKPSAVEQAVTTFFYRAMVVENDVPHWKTFDFATRADAEESHAALMAQWQPLVWEGSVNQFLTAAHQIQKAAQMFQPDIMHFASPAPGTSLRERLEQAFGRDVTTSEVLDTAWVIGMWLVDSAATQNVPADHEPIVQRLEAWCATMTGVSVTAAEDGADVLQRYQVRLGEQFAKLLQSYHLHHAAHFPHELLQESVEVRLAVVAGVIDGEGQYSTSGAYEVSSKEHPCLVGFTRLARSLGFTAGKIESDASTTVDGKELGCFRVQIAGSGLDQIQTTLPSKRALANVVPTESKDLRCDTFTLERIPHADYYGFTLDGPNGRCMLADGTVTHNTVNVYQYLSTLPNDLMPLNIIFSAATTSSQTEAMLFGPMVKRRQRVFGPPLGKRFVIFVDDMNMPKREKYFAQPPIELLRQFMDHGGWYDIFKASMQFVEIVDVSFIGAMGPPGGGRNPVTPRFLRHFNQVAHTDLSQESLYVIFNTIVENSLAKFTQDVQDLAKPIVEATIHVYHKVSAGLLPTPSKSHYTFNLRDLSGVFQGMLSASARRITTVPSFMRLWVHENRRVFKDRLINDDDRTWLDALLSETLQSQFNIDFDEIMPPHALIFGDFMDGLGSEQKMYDEVHDPEKAVAIMNEALNEYGDENSPMKLVLFQDAVEHISRISRILRQPGGNALLLGVGGSGRQSLTKLATFMAEYEIFQIEITKNYGPTEFHDDLKKLLLDAGLKEQPTVFLLNDTQMVQDSFWDDVNNILNSGEVPNLFSAEDQDNIFATCRVDCQRKNLPATKINAYAQFIGRIKANLHIVLCMSPMSAQFRTRLRMYPALVNCTTIDWFSDWSADGLNLVATTSLTDEELKLENIPAVVHVMQSIHSSVGEKSIEFKEQLRRYNYVTPTSYLELLNVFKFLLHEKRTEVGGLRSKLQYGLDTLASAGEDIARLQVDLREKEPRLVETQQEVETTMQQIAVDKKDAAVTKEIVEKQQEDAAVKAAECKEIRDDAQSELDRALPMLDKALESLKELNKTHIDEVRNFKKPPSGVVLTMEAACFPELDHRVLTDRGFLFLKEIEALIAQKQTVHYASYSIEDGGVNYVPGELFIKKRDLPSRLVDFTQGATRPLWQGEVASDDANHLSVRVTPDHRMYAQVGESGRGAFRPRRLDGGAEAPFQVVDAEELTPGHMCSCIDAGRCIHGRATIRMQTVMLKGALVAGIAVGDTDEQSPVRRLGLTSEGEINAFLELYGYWINNGALQYQTDDVSSADAVTFSVASLTYMRSRLSRAGLVEGADWRMDSSAKDAQILLQKAAWFAYFDEEYWRQYKDGRRRCAAEYTVPAADSAKCLAPWVLQRLCKDQMRRVLTGLRKADGQKKSAQRQIVTSSVQLREQVTQACLHAGYSPIISSNAGGWAVSYTEHDEALIESTDVQYDGVQSKESELYRPAVDGRLWCVQLPESTDHLLLVQRARTDESGVVSQTSRPMVIGNCIMLRQKLKLKIVMKADANGMKTKPDYWETAQRYLLKQPKLLLETLRTYDKNNIPDKTIEQIKPYILREDFSVKKVELASVACRAICMWCHAMFQYSAVNKTVQPKRVRLKGAEDELEKVMSTLHEAQENMRQVEERLQHLTDKFESLVAESESLKLGVEQCQVKLERANKLIGGLGGEKVRWETTVASLDIAYNNIVGDVMISAATIAYLGAFTSSYRQSMVADWRGLLANSGIAHTDGCNIRSTLGDPVQIRAWNIAGLPTDEISVMNSIVMSKARRWPLMIDPQGQAGKFIKKLGLQKFADTGMDIVKLSDKNFLQSFENAIRFGKWVLLEDIGETLDPALEPLLLQQIVNVKGVPHIKIGDNTIQYDGGFHLYICTKLPNPHYAPELQVKVTLLNFTITPEGLEDQMLGVVVAKESPELEQKKNALVVQNARMKKQLQDTEDQILRLLSQSEGDILDDEELINTLADSKNVSAEITERVAESEVIEKEIDQARLAYTDIAVRASILYFTISDLSMIDPMYQYSLSWFVQLFVQTVSAAPQSTDQSERLRTLITYFTRALYENICRSLFESHKLLFSFLLTVRIKQGLGAIQDDEWRFLVAGAAPTKLLPNPASDWLTEAVWANVLALSDLTNFAHFESDFIIHLKEYKQFFDSATPELERLSEPWESKLTQFQKLLVLRCLRPDKMMFALQKFVSAELGSEYIEAPQFSLVSSFKDSTALTPLIFILSKGADPAGALFSFATEMGFRDRFQSISLGQGQGTIAARYIEEGMKRGNWVLLQNAHLALSWLPTLERILLDIKPEEGGPHEDFRLWVTSEPTDKFPVSILQNGIKMTNEPPKGLRANLMRSYLGFTDASLNKSRKPKEFKKLLYALCFFHAVILDRRRFGPLGWCISYQFTENDLNVCITQLRDFIEMYADIPYRTLHFLTYDINYGGRVTDDVDRRTICTILDDFINERVLSDDYSFTPSGKYLSIPTGTREHYLKHISTLDINPDPEVFGMHENADITSAQEDTNVLFNTILALLPRASSSGGKSREQTITETASSILDRMPQPWELESVQKKFPTNYHESFNTVVVQETIRYNKLIITMRQTLEDLGRAVKGEMVMTEALEGMATSLFNNVVPDLWVAVSYPSLMSLSSWVTDFLARHTFINGWIESGTTPTCFWISGLFFQQGLMTGTLQNYARKYKKPIDAVSFSFHIVDRKVETIMEKPKDGIYIHGLYLEGARWDPHTQTLGDSRPKELFTSFPVIWLLPTERDEQAKSTLSIYRCPVYKVLTRKGTLSTTGHSTNFVLFVDLPTKDAPAKWIKAGVALFTALRY